MSASWKAGTAAATITPEEPLWLAGYGGIRQAEGKRHDLWIKALALEDGEGRQGLVLTSDLVGFSKSMFDRLLDSIQRRHGLSADRVMLTYSHNHCAPVTSDVLTDYYPLDDDQWRQVEEYSRWLEARILEVIGASFERLAPATLAAGEGRATFAVNRRNNREAEVPDQVAAGLPLQGPVDHRVPVLAVRDAEGQLTAILFGYACHTTTLNDCLWCGDYAGYAQIDVEERFPGARAMFWAGCGGDQNPLPRRTPELCERYGRMLAESVVEALEAPMRPLAPQLRTALAFVPLAFEHTPTRAGLIEAAESSNPIRRRWAARTLARLDAGELLATSHDYAVQVWRLGEEGSHGGLPLLWIALGGEAVVDYALRFRREFGPQTWTTGYAHDLVAYIPSRRVWEEGGYEGGYLYEYGWPADRWAPDVEYRVANAVHRLVRELTGA
jgi:hypothetical protein